MVLWIDCRVRWRDGMEYGMRRRCQSIYTFPCACSLLSNRCCLRMSAVDFESNTSAPIYRWPVLSQLQILSNEFLGADCLRENCDRPFWQRY